MTNCGACRRTKLLVQMKSGCWVCLTCASSYKDVKPMFKYVLMSCDDQGYSRKYLGVFDEWVEAEKVRAKLASKDAYHTFSVETVFHYVNAEHYYEDQDEHDRLEALKKLSDREKKLLGLM